MDNKLLTVAEAAAICKVSRSFFYQHLLAKGEIRSIKLGRSRRIPVAAVDEFIERQLREQEEGDDQAC